MTTTPAYDLRSKAATKGNRPFLPPKYKVLMHLGYGLIGICAVASIGYFAWGTWLKWKRDEVDAQVRALDATIQTQDHMLWLADWRSSSLPMQELLVEFFKQLPDSVRLSQLQIKHNSSDGTVDLNIAINSDRNTSAQVFRDMTSFLQSKGLAIQLIEQNPAVGATVFKAKFRITRRMESANPASAPAAPTN